MSSCKSLVCVGTRVPVPTEVVAPLSMNEYSSYPNTSAFPLRRTRTQKEANRE